MKDIHTIKKIMLNGTSLTVNITKEARELGLDRGDAMEITLRKVEYGKEY